MGEFQPPREDLNAPDLYIPCASDLSFVVSLLAYLDVSSGMALVTYILLAALQAGLESRFHPEVFGVVATKAIVVLILDFLFVKGGCYLLGIQGSNPIIDLIAYGGYKFVGCVFGVGQIVNQLSS
jgi:hypothetical protein